MQTDCGTMHSAGMRARAGEARRQKRAHKMVCGHQEVTSSSNRVPGSILRESMEISGLVGVGGDPQSWWPRPRYITSLCRTCWELGLEALR